MEQLSRQHWSAQRYAEAAHFVPALGAPVLELLAPLPGEHILDLGCGDGVLTEKIAAAGAVVVAVDAAPDMVAAARARGLDARVVAGQNLDFDGEFDAVFSNAALHWMRPPEAVLAGVFRALKPGGRFVGEMGGHNNTAAIMVAIRAVLARRGLDAQRLSPWWFPSAAAYRARLEAAGFAVDEIAIVPRPTPLSAGLEAWLDAFTEDFFGALPPAERAPARSRNRRPAAPDPDGRERRLDRRLCPAALSRNPRPLISRRRHAAAPCALSPASAAISGAGTVNRPSISASASASVVATASAAVAACASAGEISRMAPEAEHDAGPRRPPPQPAHDVARARRRAGADQ